MQQFCKDNLNQRCFRRNCKFLHTDPVSPSDLPVVRSNSNKKVVVKKSTKEPPINIWKEPKKRVVASRKQQEQPKTVAGETESDNDSENNNNNTITPVSPGSPSSDNNSEEEEGDDDNNKEKMTEWWQQDSSDEDGKPSTTDDDEDQHQQQAVVTEESKKKEEQQQNNNYSLFYYSSPQDSIVPSMASSGPIHTFSVQLLVLLQANNKSDVDVEFIRQRLLFRIYEQTGFTLHSPTNDYHYVCKRQNSDILSGFGYHEMNHLLNKITSHVAGQYQCVIEHRHLTIHDPLTNVIVPPVNVASIARPIHEKKDVVVAVGQQMLQPSQSFRPPPGFDFPKQLLWGGPVSLSSTIWQASSVL